MRQIPLIVISRKFRLAIFRVIISIQIYTASVRDASWRPGVDIGISAGTESLYAMAEKATAERY